MGAIHKTDIIKKGMNGKHAWTVSEATTSLKLHATLLSFLHETRRDDCLAHFIMQETEIVVLAFMKLIVSLTKKGGSLI